MKVVSFSDTHGQHKHLDIPDGDLLIFAGDYQTSEKSGQVFIEWMGTLPHKHKILVAGNHDSYLETIGYDSAKMLCELNGITYLCDTSIEIEGIKIHGSPFTPTFGMWSFMASEPQLEKHWELIPNDTQILITHGPQHMVSDLVVETFGGRPNVGSITLANAIEKLSSLKWHLFGHIHEGKRETPGNGYTSINLSTLDHRYNMAESPFVFDI